MCCDCRRRRFVSYSAMGKDEHARKKTQIPNEGERRVNIIHSAIQEVNTKKVAKRVLFWPEKGSHVYLHLAL